MGLLKLLMLPFIASHFTACVLWLLGRSNLENAGPDASWIGRAFQIVSGENPLADQSLVNQYICAMYFSITVMSTVGFGDITAQSPNEQCVLMIMMLFTSALVGVVVQGISNVLAKMTE